MRFTTPHGHHFLHHGLFAGPDYYDSTGLHRGWLAALGILYLLLGIVGLGYLFLMTLATVYFFGGLVLVGGIVQLAQSFTSHGWRNIVPAALFGILYLVAAALIFYNPVVSSLTLTFFLAASLLALGFVRIAFAVEHRNNRYWTWSLIAGALSIVLGFLIMVAWPATGLFVIGLFASLELIFHGAAALTMAIENIRPAV